MGRPLRNHAPGTWYLVTSRCHQARFLLRPDAEINYAVVAWLFRAQQIWPGVLICAVCVMSNHLHLVVRDTQGELARWAGYFLGNLARATNRIRKRQGSVFSRRYSAEPILDQEALLDRLVYVVTNPVHASLCKRATDWPGVILWARTDAVERHSIPPPPRGRGGVGIQNAAHLVIHPVQSAEALAVATAVEQVEESLRNERRLTMKRVIGRAAILRQNWKDRPSEPKRSPRPPCHAADRALVRAFREAYSQFVVAFREASTRLRAGLPDVTFPPWSYPPGQPLVRAEAG